MIIIFRYTQEIPMEKSFFILVLLSAAFFNHIDASASNENVSVSGYAEVSITPDIAKISFSVSETRSSVVSAQKYTSRIVENTLKLLSRMDIDEKRISTTGTSVNPVYHWNSTQEKQELTGYSVRREIRLELDDLAKLGTLIEEAGKLGITHIASPRFDSSERKKMQKEAYELAFLDAKETASILANAAGKRLGGVITIDAKARTSQRPIALRNRSIKTIKNESKGTNYLSGDITLSASVNAAFRLN